MDTWPTWQYCKHTTVPPSPTAAIAMISDKIDIKVSLPSRQHISTNTDIHNYCLQLGYQTCGLCLFTLQNHTPPPLLPFPFSNSLGKRARVYKHALLLSRNLTQPEDVACITSTGGFQSMGVYTPTAAHLDMHPHRQCVLPRDRIGADCGYEQHNSTGYPNIQTNIICTHLDTALSLPPAPE